ncbi:hypothetical protein M1439_03900 [Candidatus Marsarchaeota archaeon]|nr:hypothetical protein [Candidatus Marsarchaeota archaeon]
MSNKTNIKNRKIDEATIKSNDLYWQKIENESLLRSEEKKFEDLFVLVVKRGEFTKDIFKAHAKRGKVDREIQEMIMQNEQKFKEMGLLRKNEYGDIVLNMDSERLGKYAAIKDKYGIEFDRIKLNPYYIINESVVYDIVSILESFKVDKNQFNSFSKQKLSTYLKRNLGYCTVEQIIEEYKDKKAIEKRVYLSMDSHHKQKEE